MIFRANCAGVRMVQTMLICDVAEYKINAWGLYAARRFCEKNGIDWRLVRLARQLHAATNEGF